jgi:UDP:flavonoid glycosyltransferase YjiC (YdhE family)
MARIVVTSAGTAGDFVPFLALGRRLRGRGHDVVVAVNPAMIPLAERSGLDAVPCGRPLGHEEARRRVAIFNEGGRPTAEELEEGLRQLHLAETFEDLRAAVRGADLLVSSSLQGLAPWVHEAVGIPWINATIFPMEFHPPSEPEGPDGAAERAHWRILFDHRNRVRRQVGLAPLGDEAWRDYYWSARLVLVASSAHFCRPPLEGRPQARMTGFWFDEPAAGDWSPDPALGEFLARGAAPLVLSFSSLPLEDPARVVALHAEAATLLGLRLIIQQGWAGLTRDHLPAAPGIRAEDIFFAGHVPHDWLFPRCAAVIHHGGIGTTAQALRCGRPALVEPYCNDQFYNAGRIAALGVGAAADHRRLTPENLAGALSHHVLTEAVRRRAEAIGGLIGSEDGLALAAALIEPHLPS